jgi:hypothetical protein
MGAPLGNKNAAYTDDERNELKVSYLTWIFQGNYPSYFPDASPEIVESWFVLDTEKEKLDSAKRFYKNEIFKIGLGLAKGERKGDSASWIFISKNVLGFRDKQEIEHSGDMKIVREYEIPEKLPIGAPVNI